MPRPSSICRCLVPLLLSVIAWGQTPIGELFPSEPGAPPAAQTAGTGMEVTTGTEVTAGIAPATLKLFAGGQVRICPRTRLTVNSGAQGIILGMGAGDVEVDLSVAPASANTLLTPDFSIALAPGKYHFAIGVANQGDTCFRPLSGNKSGLVFTELLGSEVYGLAADETAVFPGGKLASRAPLSGSCGCPPPPPMLATATPPAFPDSSGLSQTSSTTRGLASPEPLPKAQPAEGGPSHLSVETPFVFSANAAPPPIAKVDYSSLPNVLFAQEVVDPPVLSEKAGVTPVQQAKPAPAPTPGENVPKKEKKGFFARIKGFFGGLFNR